jgi:hypothetical protein
MPPDMGSSRAHTSLNFSLLLFPHGLCATVFASSYNKILHSVRRGSIDILRYAVL